MQQHLGLVFTTSHDDIFYIHFPHPVRLEDGAQHKNLRIFSVSTGEELIAFTQKFQEGWDLLYTISESHAIRLVSQEVQVFRPAEWGKGVVDKLRVEGASMVSLSPGLNPSIAVFVGEKKVLLPFMASMSDALTTNRVPPLASRFTAFSPFPVSRHVQRPFIRPIVPR